MGLHFLSMNYSEQTLSKDNGMEIGRKMNTFTLEKLTKYYLSLEIKVNINSDESC